jgi:hypothetical protein
VFEFVECEYEVYVLVIEHVHEGVEKFLRSEAALRKFRFELC